MRKKLILPVLAAIFILFLTIFADFIGLRGREVTVSIVQGTPTVEIVKLLKENKVDLVYYSNNRNADADLSCCYCREETLCFVTAPNHPLTKCQPISLQQFLQQPIIVTEQTGVCYQRLSGLATERGLELQHTAEVDNTRVISELVSSGMGCAFLPRYSVQNDLRHHRLAELNVDVPPQIYYSQIVHHKDKWLAPYASMLIELIRQSRPETKER